MIRQPISDTLEAALDYRAHGWSVIPVIRGTKRPAVRWLGYQEQPPGETDIRNWYRRWPDANVAIATGSGGRHLYFVHPGGELRNKVGLAAGIDLRGDGGYIVAPPSLHASGRRYRWRQSHDPGSIALASMPDWLHRHLAEGAEHPGHPLHHWRSLVHTGVAEGERNNTIASLTGHLLWHGVDPEVAMELLLCWNRVRCRPPLADDEVIRTVLSITRLHQSRDTGRAQDDLDA